MKALIGIGRPLAGAPGVVPLGSYLDIGHSLGLLHGLMRQAQDLFGGSAYRALF